MSFFSPYPWGEAVGYEGKCVTPNYSHYHQRTCVVERTSTDLRLIRLIQKTKSQMDSRLPEWARRSNPIIRRQLGPAWKTILPEVRFLKRVVLIQVVLIALSLPWPFLFDLALPAITASILLFPFALFMYGHVLLSIGISAATSISKELQQDTLNLLRVTPLRLENILGSKIAASIWRQVEDLGLLVVTAALLSMPLLISQYATLWPLKAFPLLSRTAMILGLIVSLVRMALEPFMIGSVGIAMGVALRVRAPAVLGMVVVGFFYYLFLNLLRFVPMSWQLRFLAEFALPLLLPLAVTWASLRLARWLITRG